MSKRSRFSPGAALRIFGLRQTIKGALIMGLFAGSIIVTQGLGYAATYTTELSRQQFAATFESAPALGILYGESKNLESPASYMVYRAVPVLALIATIWGLVVATKLLRGQEEDGKWEFITSSSTTARQASAHLLLGFSASILVAFIITLFITFLAGRSPDIAIGISASSLITLAIFLPAIVGGMIGFFVSQLARSRKRALTYGLITVVILFALRSIGNTIPDVSWLKNITPLGWSDRLSPVIDPQVVWLLPFIITSALIGLISIYIIGKRDLDSSILPESDYRKPRYTFLKTAGQLALRQSIWVFIGWGLAAIGVSTLTTAVAGIAAQAVIDSPSLTTVLGQLGGSLENMKIAFIGIGAIFTVILLHIMAAGAMAAIRATEARNHLDHILTQPVHRSTWLLSRLVIVAFAILAISVVCALATWLLASYQDISIELDNLLLVAITLTGPIIFTLGVGTLLYGIWPRIAAIFMYIILTWSFVVDILQSIFDLPEFIINSSLFHYVSLSPTEAPNWTTFAWLISLGAVMALLGIFAFTKRDIISE